MNIIQRTLPYLTVCAMVQLLVGAESSSTQEEVIFSAMGCGPYDSKDELAMLRYIALENTLNTSEFIVHLGDITHDKNTDESVFISTKHALTNANKIPTYIVPGDNEWNDQADPEQCWSYWSRHLLALDDAFEKPWKTSRQAVRPENFSFIHKGVLFIGLNLPGGKVHNEDEWQLRHSQNVTWVKELLEMHQKDARAAVLFFQAALSKKHKSFTTPIIPILEAFKKPVLLLHADHHKWIYKEGYLASNITRIQTDKMGNAPPVQIRVLLTGKHIFEFDCRIDPSDKFQNP